eukprot:scaffold170804_cov22-Prasinocladus_malaysianus.AAC.1
MLRKALVSSQTTHSAIWSIDNNAYALVMTRSPHSKSSQFFLWPFQSISFHQAALQPHKITAITTAATRSKELVGAGMACLLWQMRLLSFFAIPLLRQRCPELAACSSEVWVVVIKLLAAVPEHDMYK